VGITDDHRGHGSDPRDWGIRRVGDIREPVDSHLCARREVLRLPNVEQRSLRRQR
jgi:hypothetical protein